MKIIQNEDKELVSEIRAQITKNEGHCCCAIVFDETNLCPCKDFREQVEKKEEGYCHCGLYRIVKD